MTKDKYPTIKVRYYCGNAVGAPYWQTVDIYESDECGEEGVAEVLLEDWEQDAAVVECPKCKGEILQEYDGALEFVPEEK